MDRSWRVVYRGPELPDDVLRDEPARPFVYVSGHGGFVGAQSRTFWVRAASAAEAEEIVRDATSATSGVVLPATQLSYTIFVSIPEGDADAIDRVRVEWGVSLMDAVITSDPSDGFAELLLEVVADTDDGAARRGLEAYRDLRIRAGLPPHPDPSFRLDPPWPGRQPQRRHRVLLERAWDAVRRQEYEAAVVTAQSAFEVLVDQAMLDAWRARDMDRLGARVRRHIRTCSLGDKHTRQLWDELMGDNVGETEHWPNYTKHIERRNGVVHNGQGVGEADARESVESVQALIEHIEALPTVR